MPAVLGNLIAIALVLILVAVSAKEIWKGHKKGGCGGGCAGCSGSCAGCTKCMGKIPPQK